MMDGVTKRKAVMTQGQNPQNPYQSPYSQQGQPQQPAQQPPYGYGQQTTPQSWNPQGGYGQGSQPVTGWGQQSGYPTPQQAYQQGGPAVPYGQQPHQRSPLLGMIALGGVVICAVVLCWLTWRIGVLAGPVIASTGGTPSNDELTQLVVEQLGNTGMLALNAAGYGGMGFWIAGIVATASRRGRAYGVWAIILGVLAPLAAAAVMVAALMPYMTP